MFGRFTDRAAQLLSELGAGLDPAREQVIQLLDEHRRKRRHQP